MASLVESLMQQLESRGTVDQIAGKLGVPAGQANSAVSVAVPAILAGLARNSQKPDGAAALSTALDDHDGSVLQSDSYFDSYGEQKGDKIVGHALGEQGPAVTSQVSALGGLSGSQGADLMKMLAPLIMGFLGQQKSSGALDTSSLSQVLSGGLKLPGGLGDLLGGLGGGAAASTSGGATQSPSGGIGGLLAKLFGRK